MAILGLFSSPKSKKGKKTGKQAAIKKLTAKLTKAKQTKKKSKTCEFC